MSAYSIKVDSESLRAINFSSYRYAWSDHLSTKHITENENGDMSFEFTESEAFEFHTALEQEDFYLALLSPNSLLYSEIYNFINSIEKLR